MKTRMLTPAPGESKLQSEFHFVYVLFSDKDHKLYIGYSRDVNNRLEQHNTGLNKSTAVGRPFRLIYFEAHIFASDALRRESYFKTS